MEKREFDILYTVLKKQPQNLETLIELCKGDINIEAIQQLQKKGLLGESLQLTEKGMEALAPYRVDNAIIMAAGLSSRCLPLSKILPKGLFRVKGEVLIEREIEQLREAGIEQIVLVTGYLKEKFAYLKEKYGVILVENPEYDIRNNTSSLFAARKYMGNSYICCADNYFQDNLFENYVYDSYYTCKYTEEFLDEFCLTEIDDQGYIKKIKRGGEHSFYTMGAVYFSRSFSEKFMELLEKEYQNEEVKGMLIDTFHIVHMDELPSMYVPYSDEEIKEFDTIPEFIEFDPDFVDFYNKTMEENLFKRYQEINRYAGVPTDWVTGRLHYNENLFGPSPKCLDVLYQTSMEDLYLYESTMGDDLLDALEEHLDIPQKNLFLHNGSAETIKSLFSVMINQGDTVLLPTPGWSYYSSVVEYKFGNVVYYDIVEGETKCKHNVEDILEKAKKYLPKVIVITSPAMPTGNMISLQDLERIVRENPGSMVLVDEAYYGYAAYGINVREMISKYDNVVFSRTFSKYYGLANLRIGYGICNEKAMHALWLDLPLHRLPHIGKRMAIAALRDEEYYRKITDEIITCREWFCQELNKLENVKAFQSDANFVYIALSGFNVEGIRQYMKDQGYLIRIFEGHQEQHLRITIGPRDIMEDCLHKLVTAMARNRI